MNLQRLRAWRPFFAGYLAWVMPGLGVWMFWYMARERAWMMSLGRAMGATDAFGIKSAQTKALLGTVKEFQPASWEFPLLYVVFVSVILAAGANYLLRPSKKQEVSQMASD